MHSNTNHFRRYGHGILWGSLALCVALPSLLIISAAFLSHDQMHLIKQPFSMAAFQTIAHSLYPALIAKTFITAIQITLLCLIVSYPCALALLQLPSHLQHIALTAMLIPFWTSTLVRTYAILSLLSAKGWLSSCLLTFGIIAKPLAINFTSTATFIGLTYALLPMMLLPIYLELHTVEPALFESARDLGVNVWRRFWYISLPLTRKGAALGCLLVGLPAMGLFFVPEVLGGAKGLMIGNLISDAFISGNWPLGSALCLCLILPLALLLCCSRLYQWMRP